MLSSPMAKNTRSMSPRSLITTHLPWGRRNPGPLET